MFNQYKIQLPLVLARFPLIVIFRMHVATQQTQCAIAKPTTLWAAKGWSVYQVIYIFYNHDLYFSFKFDIVLRWMSQGSSVCQ